MWFTFAQKQRTMKEAKLSLETAKQMYAQGGAAKSFALDNYTEAELTKKSLPKTWEELGHITGYYTAIYSTISRVNIQPACDQNQNVFLTEPQAEASIALAQLSQLREVYREGWTPDWENNSQTKWCIEPKYNGFEIEWWLVNGQFLSFQSKEIAQEFLNNFRDLIEQAKPLMS